MKRIYIVALFTLFFSGAYAQPGAYRENPFIDTLYLQKCLIVSDLIRIAMDSCISVAKKCQYVKDGIEPEVVVRQIASSDGL